MRKKTQRIKYITADFLSAVLMWFLFNVVRFYGMARHRGFSELSDFLTASTVLRGQLLVPFFWIFLVYFTGYYNRPLGKSRVDEFLVSALTALLGSLILFFSIVLNELPVHKYSFYQLLFVLLVLSFTCMYIPRLLITQAATKKIQCREWTTRVLLIGKGEGLTRLVSLLEKPVKAMSYSVMAVIAPEQSDKLFSLIREKRVSELIVSIDDKQHGMTAMEALYSLYQYNLPIKMPLSDCPLQTAGMKTRSVSGGLPLVDLSVNRLNDSEKNIKFVLDKVVSLLALIVLSPLLAILAIGIKRDSEGPVVFKQERIGYMGKPFYIYKFRTMREDAEKEGPALSSENDCRITRFGQFLRKYRLDELPQFWNVLKGDMSLVGPRPERKYYIDRIVEKAPWVYLLHNTRPGITSWGMVKYGYAKTIDEMIERLQYDIIYYENMSLLTDLKILIHTVRVIFLGKGL